MSTIAQKPKTLYKIAWDVFDERILEAEGAGDMNALKVIGNEIDVIVEQFILHKAYIEE